MDGLLDVFLRVLLWLALVASVYTSTSSGAEQ